MINEEQLKSMLGNIVAEAVTKIKRDFDSLPQEMDATKALHQVLSTNLNRDFDTRIFRIAKSYAIPDIGSEGIRAYVKAVSMPADKAKHLTASLEIENCLDNRMAIAKFDGAEVNLYCAQLDIEAYNQRAQEQGTEDGQQELPTDEDIDIEQQGEM